MIEVVSLNNIDEVLPLIRQYQEFYQVADSSDSRNKKFFSQFGERNPAGCQFLYRHKNSVAGFATLYFTHSSTQAAKVAVLNDLFTVPEMRGRGIGRKLIDPIIKLLKGIIILFVGIYKQGKFLLPAVA